MPEDGVKTMQENILERVNEVRQHVTHLFEDANKMGDFNLRAIVYFAIIECFAQEYFAGSGKVNAEMFCEFILEFSKNNSSYSVLAEIDPVTAFYHHEQEAKQANFSLDYLEDGYKYEATQIVGLTKSKDLTAYLSKNFKSDTEKHSYIKLLYKNRSKLSHNCTRPQTVPPFCHNDDTIYYMPFGNLNNFDEPTEWKLIFPNSYLQNLFTVSIENYLEYCRTSSRDPFHNSKEYRHWYE